MRVYTIGHSTRQLHELVALLKDNGVQRLADIRRYPGSSRFPHFSKDALEKSLPENAIEYVHFPDLGGRRRPEADSPNTFWKNGQFQAYADYMATPEFRDAVDRLLASPLTTAVMCAEAVPWRCHRGLLSDELTRRGIEVVHITGPHARSRHEMNPAARVEDDHLIYPASAQRSLL